MEKMKRYVKPDLCYESFELSQSVAACTGIIFNNSGSVKWYDQNDQANVELEALGVFGNGCSEVVTSSNAYNYFGISSGSGFVFGS